jgi:hypothetical protein
MPRTPADLKVARRLLHHNATPRTFPHLKPVTRASDKPKPTPRPQVRPLPSRPLPPRPYLYPRPLRPWARLHRGWFDGVWRRWPVAPAIWSVPVASVVVAGGGFVYSNPYFVNPAFTAANPYTYVTPVGLDYSQPIPLPTPEEAEKIPESTVNKAMESFNKARTAFKKGRYAEATDLVDKALSLLPDDRTMQEFRALTLFAREKYTDAAATIHAVLASGPGWNWDSMSLLYPNDNIYPRQLRALEEFTRKNPKDGASHFLLAYHYLEENDAALIELGLTLKLTPPDKLAAQLAEALSAKPEESPRDED